MTGDINDEIKLAHNLQKKSCEIKDALIILSIVHTHIFLYSIVNHEDTYVESNFKVSFT